MVFLRPVVVRDEASAEVLSNGRYQFMQGLQKEGRKEPTSTMPIPNELVLPALPSTGSPPVAPVAPGNPAPPSQP